MKKINPNHTSKVSDFFLLVVLLSVIFSLVFNPIAAIAASDTKSFGLIDQSPVKFDPFKSAVDISAKQSPYLIPATVFTNSTPINPPDDGATGTSSTIAVSGMVGPISSVSVTLNNYSVPRPQQVDFLLVGPGGQKFIIVSDVGGTGPASVSNNITLTLSDSGPTLIPQSGALTSGTFKPTDYDASVNFPTSAPPYQSPAPQGSATFTSVFGGLSGASVNGNWVLHVFDSSAGSGTSTVANGWSINIVTAAAASATTTTLASSPNPSFTNQAITLTSTTTSSSTVNTGVVNFVDNTTGTTLCSNVAVNGSGQATCVVPANTLSERIHNITATYVGNATFATSNASINQTVNCPTNRTGNTFTNPCGITIPDAGASPPAVPYPSNIIVSGLSGSISKVTLTLTNANLPLTAHYNFLLVGPSGQTYVFWSDAGGNVASSGVTVTLDDSAATQLPNSGSIASGTYRPADYNVDSDPFPSPAPVPTNFAAPTGSATFASVFGGAAPNGTWSLYASDDAGGGAAATIGNWGLTFTTSGDSATTTTVSGTPNPAFTNQAIVITANVTSSSTVNSGTVTFRRGTTVICANVPVSSGTATCNVAAGGLPEGDTVITADYNGAPGQFNISSGNYTQTVISPTVRTGNTFANNGGIVINNASTATPYPSRIVVSGLGGTIEKVTLQLNNINNPTPDHMDLLLVGPGGQKFLFMGDAGGTADMIGVNLNLDDAAAAALSDAGPITSGTYRPASYTGDTDIFPAPAPAAPYNPAAPEGTGTFGGIFNGISPNGTWSLYAVEDAGDSVNATIGSWSLTFTVVLATTTTTITSDAPDPSVVGQPYTVTVSVTSATAGTPTGTITVSDGAGGTCTITLPATSCNLTSTSVGAKTLTATYNGDANFTGSTSAGVPHTVNAANTTTTITADTPDPTNQGQIFTVFYTVAVTAPGAGTPIGNVTISDGVNSCVGTVAAGQCNMFLNTAGMRTLVATYDGSANLNSSVSPGVSHTVLPITAAPATVGGRIQTAEGRGIANARVTLTGEDGQTIMAVSNGFGYFSFSDVQSGGTYVLGVNHKQYRFTEQVITVQQNIQDLTITALD